MLGTPTLVRVGNPTNLGVPYTATLAAGTNSFMLTNPVTCTTRLTLVKSVTARTGPADAWTLSATAPAGAAAGPTGTTGVSALVTPERPYTLAESGGDPRYVQRAGANAVPIPGSTVSWQCVEIDANGNVIPGFADGLNGGVIVFIGLSVRCTAVNDTAQLTLIKNVINDNGGTAVPGDFASPRPRPARSFRRADRHHRPGIDGRGDDLGPAGTAVQPLRDRPARLHQLTCPVSTRTASPLVTCSITSPANTTSDCTFVNDDQPAHLTLVKTVTNDNGGSAEPTAWTWPRPARRRSRGPPARQR